jgi:hypothetical protein
MTETSEHLPRLVLRDDDSLAHRLRNGQRLLTSSPELASIAVQACVAEGRRFARTPEGARWKDTLSRSELMGRGRLIWKAYGLDVLLEGAPELVSSDWLDSFVAQIGSADLEALLAALMAERG